MRVKLLCLIMALALCVGVAGIFQAPVLAATTWYVDDDGGADFTTIQAAVDAASGGDTIIVRDGAYNENVDVNVTNLIITSENGAENCIVSAADSNDHVFYINADYVTVSGFTVQDADGTGKNGIFIDTQEHCMIKNNLVRNNYCGIYLLSSSSNDTTSNNVTDNGTGIYVESSSNGNITGNTANSNGWAGIHLWSSNGNNITGNTANSNYYGIFLEYSSSNNITDNEINWNDWAGSIGIYLSNSSSDNNITDNTANWNSQGIYLAYSCNDNTVTGNTANSNWEGICLSNSSGNDVTGNTANSNDFTGIDLYESSSNNVTGNTVNSNGNDGIYLFLASSNDVINNKTNSNGGDGIFLNSSSNNNITDNTANWNNGRGIYLHDSNSNTIYNNYFDNSNNAEDYGSNTWNIGKTPGANIIGGLNLGGNYWSDYAGTDTDGDGLGNTLLPYNSGGNIGSGGDNLPLVKPFIDLIVTDKSEEWVSQPVGTYTVSYTIKNQGSAAAGVSTACLYIDEVLKATEAVPELEPDETYSGSFGGYIATMSGDSDTIRVCADNDADVEERDETNNCLENSWGTLIVGVTGEANCAIVPGATVTLYDGVTLVATTVSEGDGSYSLSVPGTGAYDVMVSKTGYKDETHSINIGVAGQEYTVDMIGETGMVPRTATMAYVLDCVNHWLYPPGDECDLTMAKVLATVNSWLYPT